MLLLSNKYKVLLHRTPPKPPYIVMLAQIEIMILLPLSFRNIIIHSTAVEGIKSIIFEEHVTDLFV